MAGEGHVVSVFAPKGGVGKTTIAVNIAVALRQQTRAEVLLFDADVGVGNVTSVLDVPYRMGLADLADSPPEEWTDAAFEHLATTHAASGVRVLTWGTEPAESERVTVDLLLAALRWAEEPPFLRDRGQPPRLRRSHHGDARGVQRDLPRRDARGRRTAQQRTVPRPGP